MQRINTFELPNYELESASCVKLLNHKDSNGQKFYGDALQKISNGENDVLTIALDDISRFIDKDFASKIEGNVLSYIGLFYNAVDSVMPEPLREKTDPSREEIFLSSRLRMMALDNNVTQDRNRKLPSDLTRRYEIKIKPFKHSKPFAVRNVKSEEIGKLVSVKGIATRVTNVRPLLFVATYTCDACGHEFYKSIRTKEFTPMSICENPDCASSEKMRFQTRGSRFLKYQQLTIQELTEDVPFGGIPRTMAINVRSSCVRKCVAGDIVTVSGVFLPTQYTGFQQMKAGLTASTSFEAIDICKEEKSYLSKSLDGSVEREARKLANDPECYEKLARSIAPEIFGLEDVKKALLLLMVGGVTKNLPDGLKIRGDINVLLMGDPGVAKSQLLKHISFIAPRSVYTTGKGSSGVGLTAAVVRDPVTEEMVLEGGALVMADQGICCIDEFDKMQEGDRTSIHEVMEQQTVSISKAGICTTLNARTSVLAAANPVFGRYDTRKSPEANIVLPAALMSRFDLLFVLVDSSSPEKDSSLAGHICHVHQHGKAPPQKSDPVQVEVLRAFIGAARKIEPFVSKDSVERIVEIYLQLRAEGREGNAKNLLPTPRTLLSILRISQAHARLRGSKEITEIDVNEATRLMYSSRASTCAGPSNLADGGKGAGRDNASAIFSHVKSLMKASSARSLEVSDLLESLRRKGFLLDDINAAIDHYSRLDVWTVNKARTKLIFIICSFLVFSVGPIVTCFVKERSTSFRKFELNNINKKTKNLVI